MIRPKRSRSSVSDSERQKMAMTSVATVMSKPSSRRDRVVHPAQPADDVPQGPVVHVHHAVPGDAARVDAEIVGVVEVVVEHGGQQVVGRADGVHVAGEVEVDVLHGHDLGVAAAGRPALHAEAGAHRRLAEADRGPLADAVQPVAQSDARGRLAFAGRAWA